MRDVRTDGRRTSEDRATQPMDAGWLSFAIDNILLLVGFAFGVAIQALIPTIIHNPTFTAGGGQFKAYI